MTLRVSGLAAVGHVLLDYVGQASREARVLLEGRSSPAHVDPAAMADIVRKLDEDRDADRAWRVGGGAALAAKAWAELGLPAALAGCVGRDEGGTLLRRELGRAGIELALFESDKPTGRFCRFDTPEGEKIVASPSAARDIRRFDIPDRFFRKGWVLHIDGLLVDERDWLGRLGARAKASGMVVSMDVSTPFNAANRAEALIEFAEGYCDFVFANEREWEALGPGASGRDFSGSATVWVVKRGKRGASALERGEWTERPVARVLEPEDDVGAGDAFAAGFLAARLAGEAIAGCLAGGNENAALLLSRRI